MILYTIYYTVLGVLALSILGLAVACWLLLFGSHGHPAETQASRDHRAHKPTPSGDADEDGSGPDSPGVPGVGTWLGHEINPSTGLPMTESGVDVGGNPFGQDNRLDMFDD